MTRVWQWLVRNRSPAGILLVGSVISLLLFSNWRAEAEQRSEAELEQIARERIELLKEDLLGSMTVLYSIRSLFAANGTVSRGQFDDFVSDAFKRQRGLHALSWNPRVPSEQRRQVERQARAEGHRNFAFTEIDERDQTVPAAEHAEYFPVLYLSPMEGNEAAFGLDVNADPKRRAALERARETDAPVATAPIRLAQETGEQLGFCVALPVWATPSARRAGPGSSLLGYAVAVFRIGDLVSESLRRNGGQVAVSVYDAAAEHTMIYASPDWGLSEKAVKYRARLSVAGRNWSLVFSPTHDFRSRFPAWQPWALLGLGLVITGLLAGYFLRNASRTAEVRHRVAERTAELSGEVAERKRAEAELQDAQRDLAVRVRERTDELRRSNEALLAEILVRKRAEDAAEAANKAKSAFLANMSHEIRTPLNAILGYAQILDRDTELHGFARDAVATMANSSRHLLTLVNDVLDLAKIEAGQMELQPHDFDLCATLAGIVAMFSQRCADASVAIRLEGCGSPAQVFGDEGKLRKILINLVGNAVKFTPAGEVVIRVAHPSSEAWEFEVEDTGAGIEPAAQARIFEAFHRGPGSEETGGTGLGLAIARREVALLGGELKVRSQPGLGSCFSFAVQLGASAGPWDATRAAAARKVVRLAPGCHARVLLADDAAENRAVLAHLLKQIGCEVEAAADGRAALDSLDPESLPDIIFLDMNMPGLGGIRTARRINEMLGADRPKIVLMSASALDDERESFSKHGCDDFLLLPYSCERIFQTLSDLLGVKFEFSEGETCNEPDGAAPLDLARLSLPEDLALRLLMAAELHSTTVMKSCLSEMEQIDANGRRLAEHLRGFMFSYDMDSVLKIVSQIAVESPVATR